MEDRCPTDDELRNAKSYVRYMDCVTREDHLRSIDELLAKVPNEFQSAVRLLEAAEDFIMTAASGVVERVTARLDSDWELINAVDVGGRGRDGRDVLQDVWSGVGRCTLAFRPRCHHGLFEGRGVLGGAL
jgi:hypothetical protein